VSTQCERGKTTTMTKYTEKKEEEKEKILQFKKQEA
jgi:hypothetical protein